MTGGLSVIIPAYNESQKIASTLDEVARYLDGKKIDYEILVLNDGSTDTTVADASAAAARHPRIRVRDRRENFGKGRTVKEGIAMAAHAHCLFMDADNSTTIAEWEKFEPLFGAGARAVVASRHLPDSRILHPQPLARRVLGAGYRAICRMLFGVRASDFNCGFKAYETALAKRIYAQTEMSDWTFDVEVFCLLKKEGVAVAEVPVSWTHEDKASSLAPFRTAWNSLKSLAKLKRRFGRP
ncbi:MAG TPA: glycosyltransferase [Candidatus Eisenbacteria bacterium]|nr:glycosyltransferase [Candidatus Eisenbacteria bacterium]